MAPGATVLREWSHTPTSSMDKTPTDNPEDIPIIATLVPTIYRKSNGLFQDAYGRLGHHLNSSFGTKSNVDENSIGLGLGLDELEQGEVHIINGESIEVALSESNDVDEYIHEFKNNRRNVMSKFRQLLGRGKGKEKKGGSFRRNRKGSRDKTLKGKKMNEARREGLFPVQMDEEGKRSKRWNRKHRRNQWTANVPPVAFAQPCVRLGAQVERLCHPDGVASAPKRQNMSRPGSRAVLSRAASSHLDMKDAKCIPDCEISELADTDIFDDDRRSLYQSYTDTDTVVAATPPRGDIKSTLSYEEQEPNLEEEEEEEVSFHSFLEETITVLKENVNVSALQRTKHEISNALTQKRSSYTKAQSMPNVLKTRSVESENRGGTVEKRVKDYESRIQQLNLSSQLHCPASPRKISRKSTVDTQVGLNSPPQHVFKNSIFHRSPTAGLAGREVAQTPKVKHNDTLKVVFVGSPNAGKSSLLSALTKKSKKKPKNRKSVDINVQTWRPAPAMRSRDVEFSLWDIQGGNFEDGAHHSTQSLFFSSNTLYVLVWNMSVNNSSIVDLNNSDHSLGSEYDDSDDYFDEELKNDKRDKLIQRDIDENVMYWIDLLSTSELSDYAILPVVTFKDHFDDDEVERRCNLLMQRLQRLRSDPQKGSRFPEVILDSKGGIPKLSSTEKGGIAELEQCLRNVVYSRDGEDSVFKNHLDSKLCAVTSSVQNILQMFKQKGLKVVNIEDITRQFLENPSTSTVENFSNSLVTKALKFLSSIGKIMYFDVTKRTCTCPRVLEDYVVLCPKWISTALSLGLRWDPDSPLAEMKNSKSKDYETGIGKFDTSFPLFSRKDSIELWSNMSFVKRANKRLSEDGSVVPNMSNDLYDFLQQVCEYSGIFVPFDLITRNRRKQSYYLVPMIADQEVPTDFWSYKVKDESMTTLCHTFAPSGAISSGFMDKIAVEVMKSLFEFSFQHSSTSMRIGQVFFWKNAIYIKVIEEIEDENNKKRSCAAEFFVHMAKIDSPHYVGSDDFRKLIVSAKGYAGVHGEKIWKQGFSSVLESIERIANIHVEGSLKRQIVCPDCLRQTTAIDANVWDCKDINYSDDAIVCRHGHILHPQLLLGAFDEMDDAASVATGVNSVYSSLTIHSTNTSTSYRTADALIPAVVLVALWDRASDRIINVGSGFVADDKKGLIVTAAHVLFNFETDTGYKKYKQFFGLPNATALIGVNHQGNDSAVFTYCADIVASDVYNVDGCVLQIKSKFERPVELDRYNLTYRAQILLSSQSQIKKEGLKRLRMTPLSPREQEVRVLGYRQTGEGIMAAGSYINRTACVSVGYVCKPAKSNDLQTENEFVPRSEVIVNCSTGGGNSGGPFVNELGEVIGILSRTDRIEKSRCYLTAAFELEILLKKARKECRREKDGFSSFSHF